MAVVIDLTSSPLKSPRLPARPSPRKRPSKADEIFSLCSDDFDSTGGLSFSLSSSSKRRKLDAPSITDARSGGSSRATSLQPAFEDDGLSLTGSVITKQFKVTKSTEPAVSDSITFSSSAPQPTTKRKTTTAFFDLSDDDLPDDLFGGLLPSASQPSAPTSLRAPLSERTANILAGISRTSSSTASKAPSKKTSQFRMPGASAAGAAVVDEIFSSSPPTARVTKNIKSKISEEEKTARTAVRVAARENSKAAKDAAKEAEKERKRLDKEQKAKEKQKADDIAEVNKKKIDKKESVGEMILEMSRGFEGLSVGNQVEEYMKELGVKLSYFDEEIDLSASNESVFVFPGNLVKWRRKVTAEYNEDEGQWEPIAKSRIEQEKHVLIHLTAVEFATIAVQPTLSSVSLPINEAAMKANLDKHIIHLRSLVQDSKPIYLIEGLDGWLRKNATAKNRAYTAAVRAQEDSSSQAPSGQAARPKKRKKATLPTLDLSHIDAELIERLQLHLQLHPLQPLLHLTTSATSTATWIKTFTEHISTIPYRRLKLQDNLSSASFCMESGQVKTGENAQDTYIKMLQEVQRVTPSMAYGIAAKYANVRTLVDKFKRDGPLMLEDVKKSANKDGALSDRRLGPQVSRRLYKVFTGMDPRSMDGIA
jgi:crossover junction endonuclease EME1